MKTQIIRWLRYACRRIPANSTAFAVFVLVLFPGICFPDDDGMTGDKFTFIEGKAWEEAKVEIPSLPVSKNLQEFKVDVMPAYKFFIDLESIKVNSGDNVARYTIVIEPQSGLRNVFFEGIRCDTGEFKSYAFGLWGKPLTPAKLPQWQSITQSSLGVTVYRKDLFNYFLCQQKRIKGSRRDIIQSLQYPPDDLTDQ